MVNLNENRKKVYSQFGEDGITEKLFEIIGFTNKVCVEMGTENGNECCSKILWQNHGFKQYLYDNNNENPSINLKKISVTLDNVLDLLEKDNIPKEFDFLSVDIDSFDFFITHKILTKYSPRVLVVESHPIFKDNDIVVSYDCMLNYPKNGPHCYGASSKAWFNTLSDKYDFVSHEENGINMFFLRKDVDKKYEIEHLNDFEKLYRQHNGLNNYIPVKNDCITDSGINTLKKLNL